MMMKTFGRTRTTTTTMKPTMTNVDNDNEVHNNQPDNEQEQWAIPTMTNNDDNIDDDEQ
jgi:hypothetical protein